MTIPKPAVGSVGWNTATDAVIDHANATGNPHGTTKADVGLSNVANLTPAGMPVSTATQEALAEKVPNSQRGPIGGVITPPYAGTVTPDASSAVHLRYTATDHMTVNAPISGTDAQRMLIEVFASGGARTVSFAAAIETSQAVPGRVFTIPSGAWGYFALLYRSGTWRLVAAEPQLAAIEVTSQWYPADHGLLAWTMDPGTCGGTAAPQGQGYLLGSMLKLDAGATVANIVCLVQTAGAGFTAARNYAGIYSGLTGDLVAQTADQAAVWDTSGVKTMPLTSAVTLAAGSYFIAVIATATTLPVFGANAAFGGLTGFGRTQSSYRAVETSTNYTALPATRPSANTFRNLTWFGLS